MDNVKELNEVIVIIRGLCPRVDQYATISQPLAYCVNKICGVRDSLIKPPETEKKQENKLNNLSDEEREGILNHARETFGNQAE